MYTNVDSWSLPNNSIIHARHCQIHQKDTLCCITFCIHQSTVCQVRFLGYKFLLVLFTELEGRQVLLSGALFAWIEKIDQNPQIICRDDPQEAQMAHIDLTQLERVHTKASSQIKRLGSSVSQRRMPRDTEMSPLIMIDEKPTDGTSTNLEKSRRTWNNEVWEFCKGFRTETTNWRYFFL